MSPPGFNPMRWDCSQRGCFNLERRPKIEVFAECFPRRISFGDVDGIVEINGHGLVLEFKETPCVLPVGQRVMWNRLTAGGVLAVLCLAGNAKSMEISHRAAFWRGKWRVWVPSSLGDARSSVRAWVNWAEANPLF